MKKLHISLSERSFEVIRAAAYHGRMSMSHVIDAIIENTIQDLEARESAETVLADEPADQ